MNRLADTDSLYLRQHATNPVDWWPWCGEALAEARRTDRPILLSIGYAACHWCHVMAHESFEDAATAAAMNAGFVCIKLDREQRPDLDRAYQRAQQALNARPGGWPLTAFLDPHTLLPIFIGTYFPPAPRHGLPSFRQLMDAIATAWRDQRAAIEAQSGQWRAWLEATAAGPATTGMRDPLPEAIAQIAARFDAENGGHRGAPKFPQASELELLADLVETGSEHAGAARRMLEATLDGMARGGLQDHAGGGFFRYCVDADWGIPHFEKMLYDNAQLLAVYARAAGLLNREDYAQVTRQCAAWMQRELQLPDGAFASALDADSPGGEGAYYVWTPTQLAEALPDALQRTLAERIFGFTRPPNFEHHAWHLRLAEDSPLLEDASRADIRGQLLATRAHRAPPARDDKVLTAWNALAIAGLFRAARALGDAALTAPALAALRAIREGAWCNGKLYVQARSSGSAPGFLDDHAYLLDALLERLRWHWDDADFAWARTLATTLGGTFEDHDLGGFYFSMESHATPLGREHAFEDSSQPSGNAVAASALLRLGHLCGEHDWIEAGSRALRTALGHLGEHAAAVPSLLRTHLQTDALLVLRATSGEADVWESALQALPSTIPVYVIAPDASGLAGVLAARTWQTGGVAYLCTGMRCHAPILQPQALAEALGTL